MIFDAHEQEYEERFLDLALAERLGGEAAPDLTSRVLRGRDATSPEQVPTMAAAGRGPAAGSAGRLISRRRRFPFIAAASVVVGMALIAFGSARPPEPEKATVHHDPTDEAPASVSPSSVISEVHGRQDMAALSSSTRAIRAYDIDDAGAAALGRFTDLRYLEIRRSDGAGDAAVLAISELYSLEELHLVVTRPLRAATWQSLSTLRNLHTLGLYSIWLPDDALRVLSSLPALRRLDLSGSMNLTDRGFSHLGALTALETLRLDFCYRITDDGVSALRPLAQLRELDLDNCWRLTDNAMEAIASLGQLEDLSLRLCERVSDAGLAHLARLGRMRRLNLQDCSGISTQAIRDFRKALPACSILTGTRMLHEENE